MTDEQMQAELAVAGDVEMLKRHTEVVSDWCKRMEQQWVEDYVIGHHESIVRVVDYSVVIAGVDLETGKPTLRVIDLEDAYVAAGDAPEFFRESGGCRRHAFDMALQRHLNQKENNA